MSSFSYLFVGSAFDPATAAWQGDAVRLGDAEYRVPVLWLALLDGAGPRRVLEDDVVFASPTDEGIARLRSRVVRLASWLTHIDVAAHASHFVALLEQEQEAWVMVDAGELAGMSKEGELVSAVDHALAWLDGDDAADGPAKLCELSALSPTSAAPPPQVDLEDTCSHTEWENILGLVGAGEGWWD
ncbi:MAG TPA: hypothetical protein ENK57_09990 [Polyangiaceae bacterium]|nr:hypothetical protein [Polyangiaceae bacterium]